MAFGNAMPAVVTSDPRAGQCYETAQSRAAELVSSGHHQLMGDWRC